MKCLHVNNVARLILLSALTVFPLLGHAAIERTQIVHYDMATSERNVYDLTIIPQQQEAVVVVNNPNDATPLLTAAVTHCVEQKSDTLALGQAKFSAKSNGADARLSRFIGFVKEHSLRTHLQPISQQQQLLLLNDVNSILTLDYPLSVMGDKTCQ